ncbi:hypothetical protein MNBD_GAMMA18-1700 [hydrothermal vent metagenome]|uniref:Uncharacterized protein n=1 Tax=hydrothermal vent metagenome TaxID=652676 RepID=A0A3B0ZB87_9ZZZZ
MKVVARKTILSQIFRKFEANSCSIQQKFTENMAELDFPQ